MFKSSVPILCLVLLVMACKPQQIVSTLPSAEEETELDSVALVPSYWITADQDTLYSLTEEVEIELSRVIKDTLTLIGVGDIMMGTNFPEERYLPGNDGKDLWKEVSDTLRQADVTFGNLEGVILDKGGDQKTCKNPKVCYLFRTPESYLVNLMDAGFDVVSLANNHAGDFGEPGRASTMKALDSLQINYAGLLSVPTTIFTVDGMRYGMVAFSPNIGTVSIHNEARAIELVQQLDSLVDVVIVSFHAGAEGSKHEHVTRKTEMFYGENRGNVYAFAHLMIDHGADVIFGHGPHVSRAVEVYKNRFITYSMGNFCTYGRFNLRGVNGIAPIVKIDTNSEGEFIKGQLIPIYQPGAGGPKIDTRKRAIAVIRELTKKDFPESNLLIDDSGFITYLNR
ncbi:CapA family protein [Reichenbachiella carrageenanivorans]|uniref:CapA family protein n=1 Tax=Reichenbachiella carrageenanivorans TaxID=2979869 RepID=A0ABY6CZF8_9BACT|nr:CapA family protein [Reichenbachiella carrageenanivorans]UXX79306.1 CapA family protein [Reichenbachiella carrageenanivorans]